MAAEHEAKPFHIIVNARPREVTGEVITYKQVVSLAFPNAEFDKDLNPVDYPAKPRPADDDIRQSER